MVVFVIQVNTPPDPSTEQVKVASSPGQTQRLSGETDPDAVKREEKINDDLPTYLPE